MFIRLMTLYAFCLSIFASDTVVYQWRDQNGVAHFSDTETGQQGIKEIYRDADPSFKLPPLAKSATKSNAKQKIDADEETRKVMTAECEWLRSRIANLRRLTHGNSNSVFNDELDRRQAEWKKTQCQRGTHVLNRELLPVRKTKVKS